MTDHTMPKSAHQSMFIRENATANQDLSKILTERTLLEFLPIQPADEVEFPSTDANEPLISHIIHQMWCNESIPEPYRGFIESITSTNPKWKYRFWTYNSGRKLLKDRFSYLVETFDKFEKCDETQFNMIKYAFLYEYGGVYLDFDMENIRPLDRATFKYACIIPIKPFEQIVWNMPFESLSAMLSEFEIKLTTDIMFCRPKHPFFQLLLSNLLPATASPGIDHDQVSGSNYVTVNYISYNGLTHESVKHRVTNHSSNTPYFNQGDRKEDDLDAVYIPNSQYFYDDVDPEFINRKGNLNRCWRFQNMKHIPRKLKHACTEFERRRKVRKNKKFTFIIHHHHQSKIYDYDKWVNEMEKINITQVVPGCIIYK